MWCIHCGTQNNEQNTVCTQCGQPLVPVYDNTAQPPYGQGYDAGQGQPPPQAAYPPAYDPYGGAAGPAASGDAGGYYGQQAGPYPADSSAPPAGAYPPAEYPPQQEAYPQAAPYQNSDSAQGYGPYPGSAPDAQPGGYGGYVPPTPPGGTAPPPAYGAPEGYPPQQSYAPPAGQNYAYTAGTASAAPGVSPAPAKKSRKTAAIVIAIVALLAVGGVVAFLWFSGRLPGSPGSSGNNSSRGSVADRRAAASEDEDDSAPRRQRGESSSASTAPENSAPSAPASQAPAEEPFAPALGLDCPELGLTFGDGVQPVDYEWMEPIIQWTGTGWDASWMFLNVYRNGQYAVVKFDDPHTVLIGWYSGSPMYFCQQGYLHNLPAEITALGSIANQNAGLAQRGFPFQTHTASGCGRFSSVDTLLNEGMAKSSGGKYGYYSARTGGMVTGYDYDLTWPNALNSPGFFSNEFCPVAQNGKYGFITLGGYETVPLMFDGATHVMSKWAWVKYEGQWWQVYLY